jgi:hypothetical protein
VDEAYTLAPGGASETKDFGREVIIYMGVRQADIDTLDYYLPFIFIFQNDVMTSSSCIILRPSMRSCQS